MNRILVQAIKGKFYNRVSVPLPLPEEDAAVKFIAKTNGLALGETVYAFAKGRSVGGCRTIDEAVAAWKKARAANSA